MLPQPLEDLHDAEARGEEDRRQHEKDDVRHECSSEILLVVLVTATTGAVCAYERHHGNEPQEQKRRDRKIHKRFHAFRDAANLPVAA
jgi:hypothetical protein